MRFTRIILSVGVWAATTSSWAQESPRFSQIEGPGPATISGNPAALNVEPGTGLAGRLLHVPEKSGLRLGGIWMGDANGLLAGGAEPGKWSFNSVLIVGANLDMEELMGWKGASFAIQFLQFNGQNTNVQAGTVQGYNSLPGSEPLNRSELYQLWYRQALFDDRVFLKIGKMVPTFDFNNVAQPVETSDSTLAIPSVTGLLFTPVFVNPTLLGAIGGYYNSVSGATISVAPTRNTYLRYGFFDGNVARGVQTGMMGPSFNGYYFHISEIGADWILADKYPGEIGLGGWYQSGVLKGSNGIAQNGTGGLYLFGGQRLWSHVAETPARAEGKGTVATVTSGQNASISSYFQFGLNDSETLPVNQYFGLGFTGFGLVPNRPADSFGVGMAWSWLNPKTSDRPSELMFQTYYQAKLFDGAFFSPAVSYIPTPGASSSLNAAWGLTFRVTVLF